MVNRFIIPMDDETFLLSELIWARVKTKIATLNVKTMTLEDFKTLVEGVFSEVSIIISSS